MEQDSVWRVSVAGGGEADAKAGEGPWAAAAGKIGGACEPIMYIPRTPRAGRLVGIYLLHVNAGRLLDARLGVGGVDLGEDVRGLLEGAGPVRGLGGRDVEVDGGRGRRDDLLEHRSAEKLREGREGSGSATQPDLKDHVRFLEISFLRLNNHIL